MLAMVGESQPEGATGLLRPVSGFLGFTLRLSIITAPTVPAWTILHPRPNMVTSPSLSLLLQSIDKTSLQCFKRLYILRPEECKEGKQLDTKSEIQNYKTGLLSGAFIPYPIQLKRPPSGYHITTDCLQIPTLQYHPSPKSRLKTHAIYLDLHVILRTCCCILFGLTLLPLEYSFLLLPTYIIPFFTLKTPIHPSKFNWSILSPGSLRWPF